jgi:cobyrinic acid a,c-diamide synthase
MIRRYVNLDNIIEVSNSAVGLKPIPMLNNKIGKPNKVGSTIKLGIAKDAAFTFYYPDNLFALQEAGAELIPFSPLDDTTLPDVDGLYIGGGFPEVFMHKLSQNHAMREAIYSAINRGMPVYAECGGLIYLSRSITWNNLTLSMVGALPCDIEILSKPQGHGYVTLKCTEDNPWEAPDTQIKGHEFHYSRIINLDNGKVNFAYNVIRGKGIDGRYDGIIYKNVLASYTHIHGTAVPQWATGIVRLCQQLQS